MDDRFGRSKWAFWTFVCALLVLTAVPSAVLLRAIRTYIGFLTGAAPGTIRPAAVEFLDRRNNAEPPADRNLQFVEFHLRVPKAKRVEL